MSSYPLLKRNTDNPITAEMIADHHYNISNGLDTENPLYRGNKYLILESHCLENYSADLINQILTPAYVEQMRNKPDKIGLFLTRRNLVRALLCPEYTAKELSELLDLFVQRQYPLHCEYRRVFGSNPVFLVDKNDREEWMSFLQREGYIDLNNHRVYSRKFIEYFLAWYVGRFIADAKLDRYTIRWDAGKMRQIFRYHDEIVAMSSKKTIQDDIYNMWATIFSEYKKEDN